MEVNEFFKKVYEKQEQIAKEIAEINVTLAKQHENLQFHMYRTELNEKSLESMQAHQDQIIMRLEASLKDAIEKIDNRVKPVENHIKYLNGSLKVFGALGLVASSLYGIFRLIAFLSHLPV